MRKKIIYTKDAPNPIGPYSQAVQLDDLVYTAGQIAIDPKTNLVVNSTIEKETQRVMDNLAAILMEAKTNFDHVLKTTIYLSDFRYFDDVNKIYETYFRIPDNFPARETVQVSGLPKIVRVEISMIAEVPEIAPAEK